MKQPMFYANFPPQKNRNEIRFQLEQQIERLIDLLNMIDGDPDEEPETREAWEQPTQFGKMHLNS